MSTCTIEEKIIQRQLSKEGLQSVVDNTDQVNSFSSHELKSLFQRDNALDTRSNTHDTLRCKRCKCVTQITTNSGRAGSTILLPSHAEACALFLMKVIEKIELIVSSNVASRSAVDIDTDKDLNGIPPEKLCSNYTVDVKRIKEELEIEDIDKIPYKTVPELSKRIRVVMLGVDQDLKDEFGVQSVTLFNDFVASWTELVPFLQDISKEHQKELCKASKNNIKMNVTSLDKENQPNELKGVDDDNYVDDGDEYVEQEGCPEEEDFNRWSHHSSVRTCYGDELLQKAMSMGDNDDHGDNTISFIFGLEVNWTLLQEKIAKNAEQEEKRKLQVAADLAALNKEREEKRNRSGQEHDSTNDVCKEIDTVATSPAHKKRNGKRKKRSTISKELLIDSEGNSSDDCFTDIHVKKSKKKHAMKKKLIKETGSKAGRNTNSDTRGSRRHQEIVTNDSRQCYTVNLDDSDSDMDDAFEHVVTVNRDIAVLSDSDHESVESYHACKVEKGSNVTAEPEEGQNDGQYEIESSAHNVTEENELESRGVDIESWSCLSCTFRNSYPSRQCEVCG